MNQSASGGSMAERWQGFLKSPADWVLIFGLLGMLPLVYGEATSLWYLKHYQFFPLAWAAFTAVLLMRGHVATAKSPWRYRLGIAALVGAFALAMLAATLSYRKLALIAAIGVLTGWMLLRLGKTRWYECIAWTFLLLITIRLPVTLDQRLIHGLQAMSSQSASHLLDLTGVPHLATGNVIEIKPGKLFVEEACSGVDSFYALMAVAIMLAVWQKRGFLVNLLTIAAVPLWAWFGNVVRLYVLAYLYNEWDLNLTHGWQHTLLGLVIFSLAFGGLLTMQEALTRLLWPLPGGDSGSDWAPRLYNWLVTWPDTGRAELAGDVNSDDGSQSRPSTLSWAVSGIAIVAFFGSFVAGMGQNLGFWALSPVVRAGFDRGDVDVTFTENDLPADFGGMKRNRFTIEHRERNSMFGAHSATWFFADQGRDVILSLDFAFTVFHPLEVCYISTGSTVLGNVERSVIRGESEAQNKHINSARLQDAFGEHTYLVYTEFNPQGEFAERVETMGLASFFNKGFFQDAIGPLFQIQIVVSDAEKLTDEQKSRYQQLVLEAQKLLLPKIQELTSKDK